MSDQGPGEKDIEGFLEENRRARVNLIHEAQTAMRLLMERADEKGIDDGDGVEFDKRSPDIPAG